MTTATATTRHSAYYPAVDGLRAVAVLSVMIFHLNGALPAGFVGVDIFFVISGFVVASAATDLPSQSLGTFAAGFYARRLARIAPALCFCLVVTMLATMLFVPNAWLSGGTVSAGMGAFAGVSNIVLAWTANDYWSPRTEFNPFTHTWSLGVEEQFYLVFPLVYLAWLRARRALAVSMLLALMGLSLLAAIHADWRSMKTLAFYSLHTRFWELGAGVLLFMTKDHWQLALSARDGAMASVLGWAGLLGLAASMWWVDASHFPWPWALWPVACAVMVIASVVARPDCAVARALGAAPAVAIGKISYSLYLWHWPVIVLLRWTVGIETALVQAVAVALTLCLAWASFRYVEQPLRRAPRLLAMPRARFSLVALGGVVTMAALAGATALARPHISLSVTRDDVAWSPDTQLASPHPECKVVRAGEPFSAGQAQTYLAKDCAARSAHTIFVAGDSHAAAYAAVFRYVAQTHGHRVVVFTSAGCNVLGLRVPASAGREQCATFTKAVLARVAGEAKPGDVLFLPSLRVPRLRDQWGGVNAAARQPDDRPGAVAEAVGLLLPVASAGVRIVMEAPKPIFRAPPFRCSDWFNASNPVCEGGLSMPRRDMEALRQPALESMKRVAAQVTMRIWDPLPLLCSVDVCHAFRDGKPMFFDGDHLSGFGNGVLARDLAAALAPPG